MCCHLCGRWFRSLGSHLRVHGISADEYRSALGLSTGKALHAASLSASMAERARQRYASSAAARTHLAHGQDLARSGVLSALSRSSTRPTPAETVASRGAALATGRTVQAAQREDRRRRATERLGPDPAVRLAEAYLAGASLGHLGGSTGLGHRRVRQMLLDQGVPVRPSGHNSPTGKAARARRADSSAAVAVGTDDIVTWLRQRHDQGWTLSRLGRAVGHSSHWVRWRLERVPPRAAPGG